MKQPLPPVVLIDGCAFAYRYYYRWLYSHSGGDVKVHDFAHKCGRSLIDTAKRFQFDEPRGLDTKLVVCFDQGDGGRRAIFPEYKAARKLKERGPEVKIFMEAVGNAVSSTWGLVLPLAHMTKLDAEADDMIATLATYCKTHVPSVPSVIMTHDYDLLPQIDAKRKCRYYDARTKMILDSADVLERVGVLPSQVLEYKILTGDASDGVPGVKLIGKKVGSALFKKYGSLDKILEAAAEMGGKRGAELRTSTDAIELSRKLVTPKPCPELLPTFQTFLESPVEEACWEPAPRR